MFHVYDKGHRITSNPISFNFILRNLFASAKIDAHKLSELPYGECYRYEEFTIVRAA